MSASSPISALPFGQWLHRDQDNQRLLWMSLAILCLSFTWIKILYPFPNFIPPDSYSYIDAARKNSSINIWPIGYSKFLRLVSCFSQSHFVLIPLQFLLLQSSLLYLLFTIQYWLRLRKTVFRILLIVSLSNPLLPHISNFVSSDGLFAALSLLWLTQLLWILVRPSSSLLLAHSVVLLLAFMVRHNALYYPFLSLLAIWYTHAPASMKRMGAATIVLILGSYIGYVQYQYDKEIGRVQYSAFGGWQLAANALYGYAHEQRDTVRIPQKFKKLHTLTNRHNDSLRQLQVRPDLEIGIYHLWDDLAPLKQHMKERNEDSSTNGFKQWASMGPLYGAYGRFLIKRHPVSFLQYYLWPNLKNYYAPPVGFMGSYNQGQSKVPNGVARWFGWRNNHLPSLFRDKKIHLTKVFTILLPVINLVFISGFIAFLVAGGLRNSLNYGRGIVWWVFLVWLANMCFSVVSAPVELRYQVFPLIMTLAFGLVLIELLLQTGRAAEKGRTDMSILALSREEPAAYQ